MPPPLGATCNDRLCHSCRHARPHRNQNRSPHGGLFRSSDPTAAAASKVETGRTELLRAQKARPGVVAQRVSSASSSSRASLCGLRMAQDPRDPPSSTTTLTRCGAGHLVLDPHTNSAVEPDGPDHGIDRYHRNGRSTNTARSVGVSVSSTVSIAIDTPSASSTSSATSGLVSTGSGSHSPT